MAQHPGRAERPHHHRHRNGVDPALVQVITPDVGGGFGAKISCYPEEALLGVVAKKAGRALRWRETRSENMMAMGHGRGQVQYVTIGGSRDGKITHYQLHFIQDAGGFAEIGTILPAFFGRPMASAVYAIPNIECQSTAVVTNTVFTTPYRGAGRPEATAQRNARSICGRWSWGSTRWRHGAST